MKIPIAVPEIGEHERSLVNECVQSGWVSGASRYVEDFEERYADWLDVDHCIATNSGTTAGHLAMIATDLQPGDEVIMPSLTMVATANAVHYCGGVPVFTDIDAETWCIDPGDVENHITERTKAILPVHIYGHPAEMGVLQEIAWNHDLYLIEDAAEAHGAEWKHRKCGALGDLGFFSFYANKIITTGEGGMVSIREDELAADRASWLRSNAFGENRHYYHTEVGYGYRMTGLQAALGLAQMKRINEFTEIRRLNAWLYRSMLQDLADDGVITFPTEKQHCRNIYWMFSILIEPGFGLSRDEVMQRLAERGIETRPFFTPLHRMPPYHREESHPVAEEVASKGVNLPSWNRDMRHEITIISKELRKLTD